MEEHNCVTFFLQFGEETKKVANFPVASLADLLSAFQQKFPDSVHITPHHTTPNVPTTPNLYIYVLILIYCPPLDCHTVFLHQRQAIRSGTQISTLPTAAASASLLL